MRLIRLHHHGAPRVGAVVDDGLVRLAAPGVSVAELVAQPKLRAALADTGEPIDRPEARTMLPPIDPAAVLVNIGTNYRDHALGPTAAPAAEPDTDTAPLTWFLKSQRSWIGSGDEIRLPTQFPDRVDYEGELAVMFAAPCYRVSADDAWNYLGAMTLANDVSARDAWPALTAAVTPSEERTAWNRMMLGKQLPTFGPIGPMLVTLDEIDDPGALVLRTRLNGETVQQAALSQMTIPVPELVSRLSQYFAFQPGDAISTGTPGGVGQSRGRFLRSGDTVTVELDGVPALSGAGALSNPVTG